MRAKPLKCRQQASQFVQKAHIIWLYGYDVEIKAQRLHELVKIQRPDFWQNISEVYHKMHFTRT